MVYQSKSKPTGQPSRRAVPIVGYHLAGIPLFAGLPETEIEDLARACTLQFVEAGGEVSLGGDRLASVAFVASGRVAATVVTEASRLIRLRVGPHDVLGAQGLFAATALPVNLVAEMPSTVVLMRVAALQAVLARNPDLYPRLIASLGAQYAAAVEQLAEIGTMTVRRRLLTELVRRARPTPTGAEIPVAPTHAALAQSIGTNRETVSRELGRLRLAGMARTGPAGPEPDAPEPARRGGPAHATPRPAAALAAGGRDV
jgi:CRP/FNR family cyclic AMP-dependent transcriptional regulator